MDNFVASYLEEMIPVSFELRTEKETKIIGKEKPQLKVVMHKAPSKKELLCSTSLALGEAYMHGDIELEGDLYEGLDLFLGQMSKFHTDKHLLKRLLFTSRGQKNQEGEVTSHYDIGNDFYRLWLDESMSYSCGYFKTDEDDLYTAQVQKVDHILEKLQLKKGMTLLDIGCGWGFLLKRAAERYGVKGLGITLSHEQYRQFSKEIQEQHMEDSLQVKRMDYRDLAKLNLSFDRVVSVGMIEHVGRGNYEQFFENVNGVMKEGGLFLLHFISSQKEHDGDPFIKKYIFPGGVVPSFREIISLAPEYDYYTLDVESLRRHYTKTLLCWRNNFLNHREEILQMQGEEFTKMWELYLASCAATFHNGIIDIHQILMSKGINNNISMTRCS